jgi:hypothetical protein
MIAEDPVARKDWQFGIDPAPVSGDKDSNGIDYVCIRPTSPGIYPGKLLASHTLCKPGIWHSFEVVANPSAIVFKIYIPQTFYAIQSEGCKCDKLVLTHCSHVCYMSPRCERRRGSLRYYNSRDTYASH